LPVGWCLSCVFVEQINAIFLENFFIFTWWVA